MAKIYYICTLTDITTNHNRPMGKITDHIKKVLERNALSFDTQHNNETDLITFVFGLKGDNVHIRVNIVVDEAMERYMVRCYPQWYVPKDKRLEILPILNEMNITRWLTRVGVDPEDGELAFVWTVLCKDLKLSIETTELYLYSTIQMADEETTEVMKAVYGGQSAATPEPEAGNGPLPWTPRSDN